MWKLSFIHSVKRSYPRLASARAHKWLPGACMSRQKSLRAGTCAFMSLWLRSTNVVVLDSQRYKLLPAGWKAALTSFTLTVNKTALALPLDYASAAQRWAAGTDNICETMYVNKSSGARKMNLQSRINTILILIRCKRRLKRQCSRTAGRRK